jgi:hypothetical protein
MLPSYNVSIRELQAPAALVKDAQRPTQCGAQRSPGLVITRTQALDNVYCILASSMCMHERLYYLCMPAYCVCPQGHPSSLPASAGRAVFRVSSKVRVLYLTTEQLSAHVHVLLVARTKSRRLERLAGPM